MVLASLKSSIVNAAAQLADTRSSTVASRTAFIAPFTLPISIRPLAWCLPLALPTRPSMYRVPTFKNKRKQQGWRENRCSVTSNLIVRALQECAGLCGHQPGVPHGPATQLRALKFWLVKVAAPHDELTHAYGIGRYLRRQRRGGQWVSWTARQVEEKVIGNESGMPFHFD